MIRIYHEKQFDKVFIETLLEDDDTWSFPLEELDYLMLEHKNESFILINNRLYEYML